MREKHLLFSRQYLEKLLSNEKTTTIRVKRPRLKPGDEVLVHCGGRVLGRAKITYIYKKKLRDLTLDEAVRDGFGSLEELIRNLKRHYPRLSADSYVYVINFSWVERFEEPPSDVDVSWPYAASFREVAEKALNTLELDEFERNVLKLVVSEGSIRKAAYALGGLNQRFIVRDVLRRVAQRLEEMGVLARVNTSARSPLDTGS
ncbi:ASCH domain-containing protein [Thermofilum pendens]|uniref:ASCH domain-containing protein n=1 Tax=Thermofilum pendens (strain DSM 2475 / Hrk 5) TaxID=368408 RepID=A1RX03_THEPD|nr:ASCH domain-containing protein [Thermofilum pendens]ABL77733.1 protein of unknown function DUF437 [Thermofilum pendens Hrk 5]